jgi:hypothetical protein
MYSLTSDDHMLSLLVFFIREFCRIFLLFSDHLLTFFFLFTVPLLDTKLPNQQPILRRLKELVSVTDKSPYLNDPATMSPGNHKNTIQSYLNLLASYFN